MKITALNLFPLKSAQAYGVSQAWVQPQGLNFDREWMITEEDGTFITARKEKVLYHIAALPVAEGLVLVFNGEQCVVRYQDFKQSQNSEVWGSRFLSKVADPAVNAWLSRIFQRQVQLRWLGEESQRRIEGNHPMHFGDSNPLLLCSEKSLAQVQAWSPVAVEMAQFRANIVIDGNTAFEEEQWQAVKIGEVKFRVARCCTRCMMITRDVDSGELEPKAEPFRTLKQRHTDTKGQPIFGVHLLPENSGIIRLGDVVEPIA